MRQMLKSRLEYEYIETARAERQKDGCEKEDHPKVGQHDLVLSLLLFPADTCRCGRDSKTKSAPGSWVGRPAERRATESNLAYRHSVLLQRLKCRLEGTDQSSQHAEKASNRNKKRAQVTVI